ncbi:MarR family transcriptional regulator [Nocardioides perillae]|uniref:DNA-binding MarR family transcriptional regulator n=1 Tax=Nocardioides perillae TaxID=1119534 RepID=A0A7Y9RUS0_9ACTN|nr:DNA-binding MarR family transcriptional regulator [Nocardioides perillae]
MRTEEQEGVDARRAAVSQVEAEVLVLGRRLRRVLHQRAAALGPSLTPVGYLVLGRLVREGPARQVDLVATSGIEKGAVSRLVTQLEAAGLVERRADPDDRRACRVAATAAAEEAFARVDAERRERYLARLDALPIADLEQLAALLGRYNAAVEG